MLREVAGFYVIAEFGVVGGYGDDFVVAGTAVDHGHEADGAGFNQGQGLDGLLAEDQDIERIVVFGVGLGDEAVVGGVENGGVDNAVDFEEAGGFVELVFDVGAKGDFDDGLEVAGEVVAG